VTPPSPGQRVIIWAAMRQTVNQGSARNPRMVPVWQRDEYRGTVEVVDDHHLRLDTGERVRLLDISSWRAIE
jgi:hypothetical protein